MVKLEMREYNEYFNYLVNSLERLCLRNKDYVLE